MKRYCLLLFVGVFFSIILPISSGASAPDQHGKLIPGIEYGHVIENFSWNIQLFQLVNDHRSPFLDHLFLTIRYAGTGYFIVAVFGLVIWKRKDLVKPFILSVVTSIVIVHILKAIFWEPRPGALLTGVHNLLGLKWNSFPSADVAVVFAMGISLLPGQSRWSKVLLVLYGFVIAYGRMYLGVHFPLDVVVGGAIGVLCGIASAAVCKPKKKHTHLREAA